MFHRRSWSRAAAIAILLIAAFEFLGCGLCSGDTCALQSTLAHRAHHHPVSGDDCLCCCGHLLVKPVVHVEPVAIFVPFPEPILTAILLEHHARIDHPPRVSFL